MRASGTASSGGSNNLSRTSFNISAASSPASMRSASGTRLRSSAAAARFNCHAALSSISRASALLMVEGFSRSAALACITSA